MKFFGGSWSGFEKSGESHSHPKQTMIALSDYQAPTMPTENAMRRLYKRVKQHIQNLSKPGAEPVLTERKIEQGTLQALDNVAGLSL